MSNLRWRAASAEDVDFLGTVRGLDVPKLVREETAAFTIDGEVVAVWGLMQRWPGVADLWGVVDHDKVRGRHAFTFTRLSRRLLRAAAFGLQLRRITAFVEADRPDYRKFAALAGFEPEAVLVGAGPDNSDLMVYARRFPWGASSAVFSEGVAETLSQPLPQRPHLRLITPLCGRTTASGPEKPASATSRT